MKRMCSGSLCVNVLVSHSLWFLPQLKIVLLSWRVLVSVLSVTDGFGSVGASLNEWAQMLGVVVVVGGGQHAMPALGLMPPHPRQLQYKTVAPCIVALEPSMSVLLACSQGFKIKIFRQGL